MDYVALANLLIGAFKEAPTLIADAKLVYDSAKGAFTPETQAEIDAAYEASKAADATAEQRSEDALDEAAKH